MEPLKTGAFEIVETIDGTIDVRITEETGETTATVTTTAAMIAETTRGMIGVNPMTAVMTVKTSPRAIYHLLPPRVKEQETMTGTITRPKTLRT